MFFEAGPFCPGSQNRQSVGSSCALLQWGLNGVPLRETWGDREWPQRRGAWRPWGLEIILSQDYEKELGVLRLKKKMYLLIL